MKPNLLIRADGSTNIGLGHIFRCLALSQMLNNHFQITFVSKLLPGGLESEFANSSVHLKVVNNEDEFFNLLTPDTITTLDGYHFDEAFQRKVIASGCKLCCIDDTFQGKFVADLIINHAPGVTQGDYDAAPHTQFALGTDYVLLRQPFIKYAKTNHLKKEKGSSFICFGGSDEQNLTDQVLEVAYRSEKFNDITIVTGASYLHEDELAEKVLKMDKVSYFQSLGEQQMADTMAKAEYAIVPSSGILYEALAAGCKVLSGTYVDNQKRVFEGFKRMDAIVDAGTFKTNELLSALENLNNLKSKKVIDGKSPERLLSLFKNLNKK